MENTKIVERIKNLLDLARNNPNEHEAMAAALKAQELMAKYHVDVHEVEGEELTEEIIESELFVGNGDKWKFNLAAVIAKNFCCKVFYRGRQIVVFYGYKKDAEIATQVFKFLFEAGNKLADKCYYEYYKKGLSTKGIKNQYLIGFCDGIKTVLDRQCTALMIVTPKEVVESFEEYSKDFGKMTNRLTMRRDAAAYNKGREDGINTANARSIEG